MDRIMSHTNTDAMCGSCEENYVLHQGYCAKCLEKCYTHRMAKVRPIKLLQYIDEFDFNSTTHRYAKDVIDLKRFLINYVNEDNKFNPIIETKCPCGHVNDRNLKFNEDPHRIICDKCKKSFCSNCKLEVHSLVKYCLDCNSYRQIRDTYYGPVSQSWISGIMNSRKEHENVVRKIQDEQKSVAYFNNQDLRLCPYTDYNAAKNYEEAMHANGNMPLSKMLTRQYTKDTWYTVVCKSDPVVKIHCNDMYCAKHNPERIRQLEADGVKVTLNSKGCGRKISWHSWIKVKPTIDTKVYTKFTRSTIFKCTKLIGLMKDKKLCDNCNENSNCFFFTCLNSKCKNAYKQICGKCIIDSISAIGNRMINILYEDKIFKLVQESDGVYRGNITSPATGDKEWRVFIDIKQMKLRCVKSNWWFGYFKDLDMNSIDKCINISFHWINNDKKIIATSTCIFENIGDKDKKIFDNSCLRNKHILQYRGLDELKYRIDNYDYWLFENKQSKIITQSIRYHRVRYKFKMIFRIYKAIRRFIIYRKWQTAIKDYTLYMLTYNSATKINKNTKRFIIYKKWKKTIKDYKLYVLKQNSATKINKLVKNCIIYQIWKKTVRNYKLYTLEQNSATIINKFAHSVVLLTRFRNIAILNRTIWFRNKKATILNHFMHKLFIWNKWRTIARNKLYCSRENQKWKTKKENLIKIYQNESKIIFKKISKLKIKLRKLAFMNYTNHKILIDKQFLIRDQEYSKLLNYNIKNNQKYLLTDSINFKSTGTIFYQNINKANNNILKLFKDFDEKVFDKYVRSKRYKPTIQPAIICSIM